MRAVVLRPLVATVAVLSLAPAALAVAAPSAAAGAATAAGPRQDVIVILRDQHAAQPATAAATPARRAEVDRDQGEVRSRIDRLGGRTAHAFVSLNAVSASVPAGGLDALRADPAVSEVVPDLSWRLPRRETSTSTGAVAGAVASGGQVCPSDPGQPLLQPEALPLTRTASGDPTVPTARSLGFDGAGTSVAFIAEGIDVDQPDFIRADGSHVITDYQDFSGDGTAAATSGGEAFGDASSIAAQGRRTYRLDNYVSPAHPLPDGCTIKVQGVAPGASMVALKVFSNALLTATTSSLVQAIDWAVTVDHVDVINESFGSNPYPDDATDPVSLANEAAVAAGSTVVASTGDAGEGNTLGSAGTDPWVISVGATTSQQLYAQTTAYGFQLGNGTWTSDQPASFSSGGVSQLGGVEDLVAPGASNWAVCSPAKLPDGSLQYGDCVDRRGRATYLEQFGGTSESAPLVAGAAALVIQAYRAAHGGARPTPAQIRAILDSSADDLGLPADQQGAGLLDSYRAVQLAARTSGGTGTGTTGGLLLGATQTALTGDPGDAVSGMTTVTNTGTTTQRVDAVVRAVDTVGSRQQQTVALSASDPTGTFVDAFGTTQSYVRTTFTVPAGTDRLAATVAWGTDAVTPVVRLSLLDPSGAYAGYSLRQGVGNIGRVENTRPTPGTWTAIVWTQAGTGFTGPVTLRTLGYHASAPGTVSPPSFTLTPGATRTVKVATTAPANGSSAASLVLTTGAGATTTASVVTRAVAHLAPDRTTRIAGRFTTANGRDYSPGQSFSYLLAVPAGAPALSVAVELGGPAVNGVVAHLSDPSGEPIATVLNQHPAPGGGTVTDAGLQLLHAAPRPGVWLLTLELLNPVQAPLPEPFTVTAGLGAARVSATSLPDATRTVVARSAGATATVSIRNTGPVTQTYFLDARSDATTSYPLVVTQARSSGDPWTATATVPLVDENVPAWLVPTEVSRLDVGADSPQPVQFDVMPLDTPTALNQPNNPDVLSGGGTAPTAAHSANPVASTLWAAFPTLVGPVAPGGAAPITVTQHATVVARAFDGQVTSSTGDPLLAAVSPTAPVASPVTVPAGGTVTVTVRVAPTGPVGAVVRGTLFVDTVQPGAAAGVSSWADEVAALPYAYTIGR